jgi:hypothetical protein
MDSRHSPNGRHIHRCCVPVYDGDCSVKTGLLSSWHDTVFFGFWSLKRILNH